MSESTYDDALSNESAILDVFKKANPTNAKKVIKLATRLLKDAKHPIQRQLLLDVISAKKPLEYLQYCISHIEDCASIVEQFIEDGCHGMIMTGHKCSTLYPVKLNAPERWLKAEDRWNPEDEKLIGVQVAEEWMKEHDRGYFLGKVVLFPHFGFTGVPRVVEMKCTQDTEGLKRYPGTNYYTEGQSAAKDVRENLDILQAKVERIERDQKK